MNNNEQLIHILINKQLSIGSVESLTAGLFISTLAEVPGASKVVRGGLITYQTSFKTDLLGIDSSLINKYGVVSNEVAINMAKAGSKILKTDLTISFTGNAGPTSEPGGAEVGRVYMAIFNNRNHEFITFTKIYTGERNVIRMQVVNDMIDKLIEHLGQNLLNK